MQHQFRTPRPVHLRVELQSGSVRVRTADVADTTVAVEGEDAAEAAIEQRGDEVRVVGPRRTGFRVDSQLHVTATVPAGSRLDTQLRSADVTVTGTLAGCDIASGSGGVRLDVVTDGTRLRTGSGDVQAHELSGKTDLKAGSGRITVNEVHGTARIGAGSGSIRVGEADGDLSVKSGSGDLTVDRATGRVELSTASGELRVGRIGRGRVRLNNVSGDIGVGIPAGTPVWTDLSSATGRVTSSLAPVGPPKDGQDHVEVRARSLTGDIRLDRLEEEGS